MPSHLIIARDSLIAAEAAQALVPAAVTAERHHAGDLSMDEIFVQLSSNDLFASSRALIYIDVLELKQSKRDTERLSALLDTLPDNTTLICTQVITGDTRGEEERKVKSAALRTFSEHARVQDLRNVSDSAKAPQWIIARAREMYGLALTRQQAVQLFELNGGSMALVDSELRKLSLMKPGDQLQAITQSVIDSMVAGSPQARFYELADAIIGAAPRALLALHEWFAIEPETHRLLAEMRRRFLGLRALAHGQSVQPPYFERQLRSVGRTWTGRRLDEAIVLTAQLEMRLKSGETAGESSKDAELSALELYVADLQGCAAQ